MSQSEKQYKRERLEQIQGYLETKPQVQMYLKYNAMNLLDKEALAAKWAEYYRGVYTRPAYLRWQKQREAWVKKDMKTVKELALEAAKEREEGNYPPSPSSEDPDVLVHSFYVSWYLSITSKLRSLESDPAVRTAEDIFR